MDNGTKKPTEESPLLQDQEENAYQGTADSEAQNEGGPTGGDGAADDTATPAVKEPSTAKTVIILGSIYFGVFLAALDGTVLATLAAPISISLNSLSLLSWLASAYFIANAALQPLAGRLTDILSRRTGLIFSNLCFATGNVICGLAQSEAVMIFGRVVAGMGGGGLTAIATFVASDLIPLRKRGVVQGIGNICFGVGSSLGGVFGGWIDDVWGWRKAFLVQIPAILISAVLISIYVDIPVKATSKSPLRRIDFLGALTLTSSLVLLLVGLNSGGNVVPWTHPLVLVSIPSSIVLLVAFVYIEDRVAAEPIIPVRLLLNRTVAAACLTNWFENMSMFALIFYVPIYLRLWGLTPTQAGARFIPQSLSASFGSLLSGLLMKATGKYWYASVCFQSLFLVSMTLISTMDLNTPSWVPFVYLSLQGFSFAGMLTITLLALIASVDHIHQAVVTSASYAFRSTGCVLGITISSAVYQNILESQLWARFGDEKDAKRIIGRIRNDMGEVVKVPDSWQQGVTESYMSAVKGVFLTALALGAIGAFASLFMREHILHKTIDRK